jgi:phosphoglycolate phosphatase-like HAD superfamily hydrolase
MTTRGFIFDLDGTLIHTPLDLDAMRAACGVAPGVDLLEGVLAMEPDDAARALAIIHQMEADAARHILPFTGFDMLMDALELAALPRAIVTRNNPDTLQAFLAHTQRAFTPALDRSFWPPKPDPAALLHILDLWQLPAHEVWMVGDGHHDHDAARGAGCRFALVRHPYNDDLAPRADLIISSLDELIALITTH